jgi:hypothetical protein
VSSSARIGAERAVAGSIADADAQTVVLNALPLHFDGRIVLVEPKLDPSEFLQVNFPAEWAPFLKPLPPPGKGRTYHHRDRQGGSSWHQGSIR